MVCADRRQPVALAERHNGRRGRGSRLRVRLQLGRSRRRVELLAAVNSLVAYLYRHLNQNAVDLPVNVDGSPSVTCAANTCGITDKNVVLACPDARCDEVPAGDRVAAYVTMRGNTTYVTYTSNGFPLANLIRDVLPFGDLIADLTEPLLKTLVDSAYSGGNPIPADPSQYRPARLGPSPPNSPRPPQKSRPRLRRGWTRPPVGVPRRRRHRPRRSRRHVRHVDHVDDVDHVRHVDHV